MSDPYFEETSECELTGEAVTGYLTPAMAAQAAQIQGFAVPMLPTLVKLGAIIPTERPQALRMSAFLDARAQFPDTVDYTPKALPALKRMYLNDQMGCCVISGKFHNVGLWTGNDGLEPLQGTDAEVRREYVDICGPGDRGCVITRVLDRMKTSGLTIGGQRRKIDGYIAIDWRKPLEVKAAIYLFGAMSIGFLLPESWLNSARWGNTNSRIVGGHDVSPVGYNPDGVIVSSWGRLYLFEWEAFTNTRYNQEAYAMLSPDWYGSDRLAPSGFDTAGLIKALEQLDAGTIPEPKPPTPVPPTPVPPVPVPVPVPVPPVTGEWMTQRIITVRGNGQKITGVTLN